MFNIEQLPQDKVIEKYYADKNNLREYIEETLIDAPRWFIEVLADQLLEDDLSNIEISVEKGKECFDFLIKNGFYFTASISKKNGKVEIDIAKYDMDKAAAMYFLDRFLKDPDSPIELESADDLFNDSETICECIKFFNQKVLHSIQKLRGDRFIVDKFGHRWVHAGFYTNNENMICVYLNTLGFFEYVKKKGELSISSLNAEHKALLNNFRKEKEINKIIVSGKATSITGAKRVITERNLFNDCKKDLLHKIRNDIGIGYIMWEIEDWLTKVYVLDIMENPPITKQKSYIKEMSCLGQFKYIYRGDGNVDARKLNEILHKYDLEYYFGIEVPKEIFIRILDAKPDGMVKIEWYQKEEED